jgi:hypothetical protein
MQGCPVHSASTTYISPPEAGIYYMDILHIAASKLRFPGITLEK